MVIGFFGYDFEQQCFGQVVFFLFWLYYCVQVLVIFVVGQQCWVYVGQLVVDVGLYCWVVFDYCVEGVLFVVQQCGSVCGFGYVGGEWVDVVWVGFQVVIVFVGYVIVGGGIGVVFEQLFVVGQQGFYLVVFLFDVVVEDIFYVFQCGIGFVVVFGIGVGDQQQGIVVVFFGGGYVLLQCIYFYFVLG